MSDQVPFGKYRGRPVEDMLADAEYMAWLEAQPWFRARYMHLLSRRDAEAASRTPVHNRMQALFLDPQYALAFSNVAASDRWLKASACGSAIQWATKRVNDHRKAIGNPTYWVSAEQNQCQLDQWEEMLATLRAHVGEKSASCSFEQNGSDVLVRCFATTLTLNADMSEGNPIARPSKDEFRLRVEIKPTVADEYPAVLRQMARNNSEFLFVGEYQGDGVTEEEFVAIFAASGKVVVFKRDVDAALAAGMS